MAAPGGKLVEAGGCVVTRDLLHSLGTLGGGQALWWGVGAGSLSWCAVVGCWGLHSGMVVFAFAGVAGGEWGVRGKVRGLRTKDGGGMHVVQHGYNRGTRCGDVVVGLHIMVAVWPQQSHVSWHVAEGEGAMRSGAGIAHGQKTCWACRTSKSEMEKKKK